MNKSNRIASVELIRIIACFIVVSYHSLSDYVKEVSSFSNNLLNSIFCIGVSIFWLLTGFFLFKNDNYKKLVKRSFIKLWMPTILISIICFVGYDYFCYLISDEPMLSFGEYLYQIIYGIFRFHNFAPMCSHLWFIYIYVLIIICYPVLKQYVNYLDNNINAQKRFVIITLCIFIVNNIYLNNFMQFDEHYFNGIVPASILIIYGHLLYEHKDDIFKIKINDFIYILCLFLINIIRSIIITLLNENRIDSSSMYGWYSIFSVISALCLIIPCLNSEKLKRHNKFNSLISNIGKYTLYIYLIHIIVLKILGKTNILSSLYTLINSLISFGLLVEFLYVLIIAIIVFSISLLLSMVLDKFNQSIAKH